jgi:hypothetical protein
MRANLLGDGRVGLMTAYAGVSDVMENFPATSTLINNSALRNVEQGTMTVQKSRFNVESVDNGLLRIVQKPDGVVTVVGKDPTGKSERVYNLSVENQPEYFANNILVHNCVRYALMTWPQLPVPIIESEKVRDISKMPDEMQATIQRMRKIDKPVDKAPESITGDFYA